MQNQTLRKLDQEVDFRYLKLLMFYNGRTTMFTGPTCETLNIPIPSTSMFTGQPVKPSSTAKLSCL